MGDREIALAPSVQSVAAMKWLIPILLAGCFHGSSSPAAHSRANRYNAYVSGVGALTIVGGFVVATQTEELPGPALPMVFGGMGLVALGVGGLLLNEALGVE